MQLKHSETSDTKQQLNNCHKFSFLPEKCCLTKTALFSLINTKSKDYASIAYLADEDKLEKLLEQPALLVTPIVRNGKTAATVGFCPDTWKTWN